MRNYLLTRCFFSYLRTLTLIFFCLWLVVILFDRFLLDSQFKGSIRYAPNITPCSLVSNDTVSPCNNPPVAGVHQAFKGVSQFQVDSGEFSPYVELQPYHLNSVQLVLFWTPYFSADALSGKRQSLFSALFSSGNDDSLRNSRFYRPKLCYRKYPRCLITTNRAFLRHAKSLIFHWRDFKVGDLPANRTFDQLWTLYNLEAPPNTAPLPIDTLPPVFFNRTATYRLNSDIVIPYGRVVPRPSMPIVSSTRKVATIQSKKRPIAWFVSNCHTQSHREDYVQALGRFLPVDIFGKCGTLSCQPPNSAQCYQQVAEKYFFYLSFENSICEDYITEKLFSILAYDIVPVVFGGANYSAILPPNSFIDATEMKPKDVARLLTQLMNDTTRYLSYFKWKEQSVLSMEDMPYNEKLYCALCQQMEDHSPQTIHEPLRHHSKSFKEINEWYFDNVCNQRKLQFF